VCVYAFRFSAEWRSRVWCTGAGGGGGGCDRDEDEEDGHAAVKEGEEVRVYYSDDYSDGADEEEDDPATAALRDALTRDVERAFPKGSAGAMRRLSEEVSVELKVKVRARV